MTIKNKIIINQFIKKIFNLIGLDICKLSNSPKFNFLGLRNLSIKTIIDVGANEGQFAREISKFFPDAAIYCFEPLPEPFAKIKKWAENKRKTTLFNVALGENEGEVEMLAHLNHSPSSSFLKTTEINETLFPFIKKQATTKVKLTTLDKVFTNASDSLMPDVLIKLDVQGYEDRVIRGGIKTFRKAKACILEINLDQLYKDQANFKDIVLILYELGYRYAGNLDQTYADDGHVIFIDAVFVK